MKIHFNNHLIRTFKEKSITGTDCVPVGRFCFASKTICAVDQKFPKAHIKTLEYFVNFFYDHFFNRIIVENFIISGNKLRSRINIYVVDELNDCNFYHSFNMGDDYKLFAEALLKYDNQI